MVRRWGHPELWEGIEMLVRKMAVVAVGAVVGAAALLSACSGESGPRPKPTSVPEGAPYVDQHSLKFIPNALTAKPGETVYFVNSEAAIHTVTINGKNESGTMNRNDLFEFAFQEPGTYKITCDFHAQMKATITVAEAAGT